MLFVPESPRWLTVHDGHDDARKALTKLVFPGCTGLIQRGDAFTSEEFEYELFEFSKLSAQRKKLQPQSASSTCLRVQISDERFCVLQ